MDEFRELQLYFEHELEKANFDIDSLRIRKEKLLSFEASALDRFKGIKLDSFRELFDIFDFSMSFEKFAEAIESFEFLETNDMSSLEQYYIIKMDLDNLKKQISDCIVKLDSQINEYELLIDGANIFKKYYAILNENGFIRLLSLEELNEVFDLISKSDLDSRLKFNLVYRIGVLNYEQKHSYDIEKVLDNPREIDSVITPLIEKNLEEIDEILESNSFDNDIALEQSDGFSNILVSDDEVLNKILEIIENLRKYFEVSLNSELDSEINVYIRKEYYTSDGGISKYNWSNIYSDLCNVLIPKYKNNDQKEEITELFNFIINIYENYESVVQDFDENDVNQIGIYISKLDNINEEVINNYFSIIEHWSSQGYDISIEKLSSDLHVEIDFTKDEILLYHKIIQLRTIYKEYFDHRILENEWRFDTSLSGLIDEIREIKEKIMMLLFEISKIEQKMKADRKNDESSNPIVLEDEPLENVKYLENEKLENLVIFMSEDIENSFDGVIEHLFNGNSETTIRNIVNCIYDRHYGCSNYRGIIKDKRSGYWPLKDDKICKNLESNGMFRSRKGDIRCSYREVHVSDNNRKIIKEFYPSFSGSLFLITGVFYKTSNDTEYVKITNSFLNKYQMQVDSIIDLFKNDFKTPEEAENALSLINGSVEQYNDAYSLIQKKKVEGK